ncbi:MAG TPA: GNAT family N-acetyltransferase [Clostridiaceae bacterium]|nr:GNAT family N-acetyltransferase [Clostridiaceae bacterium]
MRNLLAGDNIKLTAIKESDLPVMEEWFNNVGFLRFYDMLPAMPKSKKKIEEMIRGYEDSEGRCIYAVRDNDTGKIIGVAGFDEIIWSNGVATVFIGIGDNGFLGKGLGKEALKLLLDFGFNELNFYRIQLNVISYNKTAINLYESLGFVREGTYREFILRDGKRYDLYLYGLLKDEWKTLIERMEAK